MKTKNAVTQAVGRESVFAPELNVVSKMKTSLSSWLSSRNETLSSIVGETVTQRTALHLGNLSLSLTALATVGGLSSLSLCCCGLWLVAAALPVIKEGGLR